MLKKLFKIGMLASLMFVAYNANAQEKNYELEYPHFGFWSNWSFGGSVIYSWQYEHGGILDWRDGSNIGANLFFEKELSPVWSMRLIGETPGLYHNWGDNALPTGAYNRDGVMGYDRYGKAGVDFKMSFQGLCKGYDPERRGNLYLLAGAGATFSRDDVELGFIGMYMQGGLGWSYKLSHSSIFIEIVDDIAADIANPIHQWHDNTGMLRLGWMYNFGPTQKDLDLIAQRALLTQENFDKMSNEIDGLRNDLRDAKTREAKLINRINELEANQNNTNNTIVRGTDDGTADSLRKVIEGYESNKHNFYALPFSITYDVDQYTVSEDQMGKINAIAQIMKDNEDVNFDIIGYCDYSGSDAYNQKLSERRAENVKKLLVRRGIAEDRLSTEGKGKTMPFGDIKNAINRRVSFYRVNK
ncbi:MAG: OmpA family protein [Bacteroidales bacterium]|nr:OmpA family protein [Bacteroidales bacterium]